MIKLKNHKRKNDRQPENILEQLQVLEKKKLVITKTILKIIKYSERVTLKRDIEAIYKVKIPTELKAAVFLYDVQQPINQLHYPAFLQLERKVAINQNTEHAAQSASFNAQKKQKPGPSRTRPTHIA